MAGRKPDAVTVKAIDDGVTATTTLEVKIGVAPRDRGVVLLGLRSETLTFSRAVSVWAGTALRLSSATVFSVVYAASGSGERV